MLELPRFQSGPGETVVEILQRRAGESHGRLAYTFLEDGEAEAARLTFGELDERARALAAALQERARPGDRALLLFPPGLDFIAALFGAMYAGVVPVPCVPPHPRRGLERLAALARDAGAALALAPRVLYGRLEAPLAAVPALRDLAWLVVDDVPAAGAAEWRPRLLRPADLAFLQYTSGSTSLPRGAMITHGNLIHNERLIQRSFGQDESTVVVGWLPLYHDMGLIGNVLQPLFSGGRCVLMSPAAFLQRPLRWLEAISRYRADTSGGPSFAYELCARKAEEGGTAGLDLSCWRLAFSGAEPVRAATLDRFAAAFAPAGFRREAFLPCYGLAEATLFVSGAALGGPPRVRPWSAAALREDRATPPAPGEEARLLASCGGGGQKTLIVDPATDTPCPPGRVGEIWVSGPSVAQGYWGRAEETARTFGARLAGGEGPFLRTGDLGFAADGELYVTGRLKDLIIQRGRNHYPQDLEATAERGHPLLRPGSGAAFAVEEEGEERVVLVQEIDRRAGPADLDAALEAVRAAVAEEHEIQVAAVVLVEPGSVPKTSSGKVQRHLCRARYLAGELTGMSRRDAAAGTPAPAAAAALPPVRAEEVEPWLAARVAARLGIDPAAVDRQRPLAFYGIDSLAAMELTHLLETGLGARLPVASFLGSPSLADLAAEARAAAGCPPAPAPAPPMVEERELALSIGQQGLLFLQQLAPDSPVHNIPAAARVRGGLNARRLRQAFQTLVDRHPALRSTIATPEGRPAQRVHARMEVAFQEEDAAAWSDAELHRRLADEAHRPFDLERGPLLRVRLFQRTAGEAVLLLTVHHIVSDFWSLAVVARELGAAYAGGALMPPAPYPADLAAREAGRLAGPEGERLWEHWRGRLGGELPVLALPRDRPRSPAPRHRGGSRRARVARPTAAALQRLAADRGATLYMGLLAAFQALLHRYSGQTDLVVGSPVAGRAGADLADVVGYFVNLLPLRADLEGDPAFEALLGRAREAVLDAFAHQDYPFARLVERLQPAREPGCPPLFQAVLVLQKTPPPAPEELALLALGEPGGAFPVRELMLEPLALERRSAEFDLTLTAAEAGGELALCLQYDADLFDAATAERLLGHFGRLLAAAVERPAEPLAALPMLSPAERYQLVAGEAEPPPRPPAEELLQRAFEAQADRRPEAVALTCEGRHVTYGELDRRADRLASRLRDLGVGPEVLVGLCAERSIEMVVGLLAILKAGGAYLPLDPRLPRERLELLVQDAGAPVLLAARAVAGAVEGLAGGARLLILEDGEAAGRPGRAAGPELGGASAAYVIYTSGSAGRPKGVIVPHRQVARLFSATRPWLGFGADDVWTLFHSFAFDFSVWEIWGALLYGGRLVVVPYDVTRSPDAFLRLLRDEGVTVLSQTPSAFRQLVAADAALGGEGAGALRWVVFGGEALEPRILAPWLERHGDRRPRLVNMYGITETTVHVTYRPLEAADLERPGSPVGVPIPDLRVYLLDARGEPVPAGVPGEIHVGGAGLARGYLGRPELTAGRFVPDPFGGEPGARLYRSGDLARRLPAGDLDFLGRIDTQVKIRGFRIEPGEIEAALRLHPGVRDAVVLVRRPVAPASPVRFAGDAGTGDPSAGLRRFLKRESPGAEGGEPLLVAYVVTAPEGDPGGRELRQFLRDKLPEYMVPAAFVRLDALPLTANGKLDVRALPAPEGSRSELEGRFEPPRGPVEEALAEVWAGVLGLDRVGAEDNFFELGGDSIRSIQVRARAEARGLRFALQDLLEHQTVRGLARALALGEQEPPAPAVPAAGRLSLAPEIDLQRLPAGIEDAYPLARIQAGVIFHSQSNPDDPMYHDIFFYHLRSRFDPGCWTEAVQRVLDRHAILRTGFDLTRYSEPLQLVHARVPTEVRVIDLRALAPVGRRRAQDAWLAAEKRRSFDWGRAPLIRFFLHRLEDEETHLVLSFHDAILDGWSTALLLTELLRGYFSLLGGLRPAPQPPPRVAFRDFVALEREALTSGEHRAFWERNLSGAPGGRLPRWPRARRSGAAPSIGVQDVPIPPAVEEGLWAVSRQAGVPIKHVLLAAHVKALSVLAGHPDVVTGLESNGRLEVEEGEQTLGIHLNSLPFRLVVPPGSWNDLVRATFEAERALLPYRRYPLAELQKGRSGDPLFEAVFNYTHFHVFRQLQEIAGLEVSGARGFGETHFALRIEFNRDPFSDHLQLDLECDVEDIPRPQLAAIGELFARTLAALAAAPAGPHAVSLLAAAERHQLLVEWNRVDEPFPRDLAVHRLFEERARRTPAALAVTLGEEALTYGELDARANRLARWLRGQGVGPGRLAGILAERSLEMVVAILGVLKAGGAYVPLDPDYPRDHLARVTADAGLALLLTQERLPAELRALHPRSVPLDAVPAPWDGEPGVPLDGGAGPEDPVYVIYTSGSTGAPKGVQVTHRNLAASTWSRFLLYPETVKAYLLVPSFSFDSSVAGIFWTLCGGGTLVLLGEGGPRDLPRLLEAVTRHRVSHLLCIPSLYAFLLAQGEPAALRSLEAVIVAGEACPPDLPEEHRRLLPGAALYNEYGPTEGTVWCTLQRCTDLPPGPVPIGRPTPNAWIRLLDADLQPVPVGTPGELYLGGEGLARGYLGQPALTAERWVPDPWDERPGRRLYRTGDLARWLPGGELEFLGRGDDQVKIRGFRIEPGEIEQVLRRHPAVLEAVVVARDDGRRGRQLAAYFVPGPGDRPAAADLRGFLAARLPEHMVPRWYVALESLPRTPSGKLDRRRLPDPRQGPPPEEIVSLLSRLETLSREEAQQLLEAKKQAGGAPLEGAVPPAL